MQNYAIGIVSATSYILNMLWKIQCTISLWKQNLWILKKGNLVTNICIQIYIKYYTYVSSTLASFQL